MVKHQVCTSPVMRLQRGDPIACYQSWRTAQGSAVDALLLVEFALGQYWLADADAEPLALTALYCLSAAGLRVAVTDQRLISDGSPPAIQFDNWVNQYQLAELTPGRPLQLLPTSIPKPWGQEIWFSAVERRGVCEVGRGSGRTPLPWLQAVLPDACTGTPTEPLLLLKILDPAPQPVTGDLYFELHETKHEVYVVTHIDAGAWPQGVGYVRYGFAAEKLAACANEQAFRASYLAAVQAYEEIRRQLDALPPGVQPGPARVNRERQLRKEMDSFTQLRPLRAGDVIVVPPGLPHAMQHGVRSVEIQTPVYERKILSFAQQVQNQNHWDTGAVVDHMLLTPPPDQALACLQQAAGTRVERIADFPDFEVRRVRIEAGASHDPGPLPDYALLMVVEGELNLSGTRYQPEQAVLLPRGWRDSLACGQSPQPLVLLLAIPQP